MQFSKENRKNILAEMENQELDLFVIGGGITGCGIALDAAERGLKVGLIEMQDFGAGTSSRSTKLIHGGLRYLKQGEIGLVREVGRERAILHKNAPHLVTPEPMLLPLIKGGTYGKLATSIGLWLYDRLAGVHQEERRRMLSKKETLTLEPLLKEAGLTGSGLYVEYRTDDARLTIEVIKTAVSLGALAVNYVRADQFVYENGQITGVNVTDMAAEEGDRKGYTLSAKKIVNATGPWVDELRKKDQSLQGKKLHLTKGVHIVVDQRRFPLQQAVYFDVEDGRMIFAIPREGKTYIGTTDTDYEGNLADPKLDAEDTSYLLQAANRMFPSIALTKEDVEAHWVGLRPLIHEEGKSPSELSRKDEIFHSESGLLTIAGGKLTGFRKMAERVVDHVVEALHKQGQISAHPRTPAHEPRSIFPCRTAEVVLSGGDIQPYPSWDVFFKENMSALTERGLAEQEAKAFIHRYGSNINHVLAYLDEADSIDLHPTTIKEMDFLLIAELLYAINQEMAVTADDFLIRRTGLAYFNQSKYQAKYDLVRQVLQSL